MAASLICLICGASTDRLGRSVARWHSGPRPQATPRVCRRGVVPCCIVTIPRWSDHIRNSTSANYNGDIPSATRTAANPLLHILKDTLTASVASDSPDFTARQLSVFLKVYLEQSTEHTVRGLAAALNVSKPAITRALDRLQDEDFIKRETDSTDRRSVIVRRTPKGASYLGTISGYLNAASKAADKQMKKSSP